MKNKEPLWTKDFIKISLINVFLFLAYQMQLSTLPVYLHELSGSDYIVGISTFMATLAALITRPFAGSAIDSLGRRKLLLTGISLLTLALLLYTVFKIVFLILIIRFLFGIGWGTSTTSSNTIAADTIPKSRFGEGMGYFSLSQSLSLALAPLIGLSLLASIKFEGLCIVSIGLLFIAVVISFFINYKKPVQTKKKFAPYERKAIKPAMLMVFVGIGMGSTLGFAVLYGKSMGYNNVGLFFTFYACALFITRPLTGKLIDKFGVSAAIIPGFAVFVISFVLLSFSKSEIGFLAVSIIQGISYGTLQTSIQAMAVINSPVNRRGAANATYFTGFDAGMGSGSLIAGALSANFGYSKMFGFISILILIGMLIYIFTLKKGQEFSDDDIEEIIKETAEDMTIFDA